MATEAGDRNRIDQLPRQMSQEPQASAWPTVCAIDIHRSPETTAKIAAIRKARAGQNTVPQYLGDTLRDTAETALTGPTPNGSSATTEKRGAPNPVFAFWLMGFPAEWISGALEAMRSYRKPRSKRSAR
jgi:hypothetical protein